MNLLVMDSDKFDAKYLPGRDRVGRQRGFDTSGGDVHRQKKENYHNGQRAKRVTPEERD
jgi:hypothetical protein